MFSLKNIWRRLMTARLRKVPPRPAPRGLQLERLEDRLTPSTNQEYVGRLYQSVLHRAPDAAGEQAQVQAPDQGASRCQGALGFEFTPEVAAAQASYRQFLHRPAGPGGLSGATTFLQNRGKKFTAEDLKLLWGVANQAAIALENARMHEDTVSQENTRRDLELAHRVQMNFLPQKLPQVPGYEFYAYYAPALQVGGDYYDFIPLADGRLAVALGDVAGKGVAAALIMAKVSSDARFSLLSEPDVGRAVTKLNGLLYEFVSGMDRFVTLAAAVLDPRRHVVTLANAGHFSPLHFRQSARRLTDAIPKRAAGVPLGILEGSAYESCQVTLEAGDSLILFSDGLPDMLSPADEAFGFKGIDSAVLEASGPATPRLIGERLLQSVTHHASGREAPDDLTLVCFGRLG